MALQTATSDEPNTTAGLAAIALIVDVLEMHILSADAAGFVDHRLGELHRLLLLLAEERGAAGQRQNGGDVIGARRAAGGEQRRGQNRKQ
jgi:hypothetical protein